MARPEFRGRTVQVYLHDAKQVARWRSEANKSGLSLSEFIFEVVEDRLASRPIANDHQTEKLQAQIREKDRNIARLTQEIKAEEDLFNMFNQPLNIDLVRAITH